MNEAAVKTAVERLIKQVSFAAQREVDKAVRNALADGKLKPNEPTTASVTLSNEKIDRDITTFSKIET